MKLTPAIKGQLTKARKLIGNDRQALTSMVRSIFGHYMPYEQAKHAAKKYLASV